MIGKSPTKVYLKPLTLPQATLAQNERRALIEDCVNLEHIVKAKVLKPSKSDSEGVRAETTANSEQVNDRCKPSLERAGNYDVEQSPKSPKSKESTNRSKTSGETCTMNKLR